MAATLPPPSRHPNELNRVCKYSDRNPLRVGFAATVETDEVGPGLTSPQREAGSGALTSEPAFVGDVISRNTVAQMAITAGTAKLNEFCNII